MIQHYLLVAYRAFRKNKVYSLLNVFGLAIGITCSLVIFLYVHNELTYDHNHVNRENIYRLNAGYHLPNNGAFEEYAVGGPVVGTVLVKDFPEVQQAVRIQRIPNTVVEKSGTGDLNYETFFAADSNIFKVFTMPFLAGDPGTALLDLKTIVISRKMAEKYFNRTDVVGEVLRLPNDSTDLKITGVMEDYPSNTHLKFDFIISVETYVAVSHPYMESWWSYNWYTYLLLEPKADAAGLAGKIKLISRKYIPDQEDGSGYRQEYALMPFSKIHLYSDLRGELEANARASYINIFIVIGLFILVIACINFMNLATARSAMRAKEIGMRKVAGAVRRQLVGQFLGEAFLMTVLAVVISMGAVYLLLPVVNEYSGKDLHLFFGPFVWAALGGITIFVALLAGAYPSIFLSAFKPVETLKSNFRSSARGNTLRKTLVVFQFAISVFLIGGTLIIMNHLRYIRSINLGFNRDRIVVIPTRFVNNAGADFKVLKNELLNNSAITAATLSSRVPGKEMSNNVVRLGWGNDAAWSDMRFISVDHDFVKTYDLQLVEGRSFSEEFPSDEREAFLVNESGMRRLGFNKPSEIIGQKAMWQDRKGVIIGVLKDFHFMSANVGVEPFLVVMNSPRQIGYLSLKVASGDLDNTLEAIEEAFHSVLPGRIFEYSFLDDDYDQQYKAEDRFMAVFMFFAVTAILIACLGLYGLAMFMSELRLREIGIRKVLGASDRSLLILLTRDFIKLVLISVLVAVPLTYWTMERWLTAFPYRENINVMLFVWAAAAAVVIALMTVSYQAWKSSRTDPVRSING